MSEIQYESLRSELEALSVPRSQARHLRWLAAPLAVARTASGDFEVFIRGPELRAASPLVRRQLQHGSWRPEEGGAAFSASRVALPSAPHFASIAALIAIELIRAGVAGPRGVQAAFSDVEPIIEMAMRRGALADSAIIGLIGELTVLRQLILPRAQQPESLMRCLEFWQGWQDGGRDFRIGVHAIEVKATQAESSIHEYSGLHQLEPQVLPSGQLEQLHLLSIGLAPSTSAGESLPAMVESIASTLRLATGSEELATEFVRRVALYGQRSGVGYLHDSMADWSVYATRYAHTFVPRLYRLDDPGMLLLTRAMLAQTFVQPHDLAFTMHVPESVSAFNPAQDWASELQAMSSD
ncbi:PD-(D/E)XK motif protein [Rubrivivax albus]|uniref:PD-(D/E)XK motif protein n=1 Tax=Rubrivivax albus TaxID=2499835 RepID=A0A437JT38_9BURK|nr:PD-(D/E)XK motif protein [Rubrivivax albus]RVT50354.1 PD-(D/E)XK motif protein [Rubrivivax albus]